MVVEYTTLGGLSVSSCLAARHTPTTTQADITEVSAGGERAGQQDVMTRNTTRYNKGSGRWNWHKNCSSGTTHPALPFSAAFPL